MKRERPSSFRQKASFLELGAARGKKTKRARRSRSAAFFDTRQSVRFCFRDDTSRASAWAEAGAFDVPPFHFHLEHRRGKIPRKRLSPPRRSPKSKSSRARQNCDAADGDETCVPRFVPFVYSPKLRSGLRAHPHAKRTERGLLGARAERRASIPRATLGARAGAWRAEGHAAVGAVGSARRRQNHRTVVSLPGIRLETHGEDDARGATRGAAPGERRRRRARFGDAKRCRDGAGHQVRAPRAIEVDRCRSRFRVPKPRAVSRTNKRARSLARAPGRADPPPPPFHSRRLSSRAAPSRDTRADSRASPRPRLDPPRAPRTRAGPVAAPSTWLIPPSRVSR